MELNVAFGAEGARLDYTRPTNGICCNVTRRLPLCHVNERVRNGEGREEGEGGLLSVTGSISEREKFSRRLSGVSYSLSLLLNILLNIL